MARQAARLILAVLLAGFAALAAAEPAKDVPRTPWKALKPEERRILGPIEDRWESLPGYQQKRFISSARKYPSLQPIQKERFDARIRGWATMSPEQRREAREAYQGLRRLPPAQQHELRERWLHRHQGEDSPPGAGPSPVTPDYSRGSARPAPPPR